MKVNLMGGSISDPGTTGAGDSTLQNERRALLVYEGDFESMGGPVSVTAEQIQRLADNHNGRIARLGPNAQPQDLPPVQLDHSTSAHDTVGRVVGQLEVGEFEGKVALYGQIRILGCDNMERVADGRWRSLSIGADLEAGELQEVTITPFPAARRASLLSKYGGNMDPAAMLKYLMDEGTLPEDEAKTNLEGMTDEEKEELAKKMAQKMADGDEKDEAEKLSKLAGKYVIAWWKGGDVNGSWQKTTYRSDDWKEANEKARGFEKDGHEYRVFDDRHGLPDTRKPTKTSEGDPEGEKLGDSEIIIRHDADGDGEIGKSADNLKEDEEEKEFKAKMTARLTAFQKGAGHVSAKLRRASLGASIARLRACGKITPAEIKKMDMEQLSAQNDATVKAVLATYENRQPVIMVGQFGSVRACDAGEVVKEVQNIQLERETLANMKFTSNALGRNNLAAETDQHTSTSSVVEETHLADDDGMWTEIVRAIRENRDGEGQELFRRACRMERGETAATDDEMSELMAAVAALNDEVGSIVQLAAPRLGIKL